MNPPEKFTGKVSLVVGPEKTATTFIQALLECHPGVSLPRGIKETFFFDRFHTNGLGWYLDRFDLSGTAPHLVEVAPGYFSEPGAIARIGQVFPQARIIICVREPVARTISHYNHMRRYGYIDAPLAHCLDPERRPLKASLYSRYCPMWEAAFGRQNVKILDMSGLGTGPAAFAAQTFEAVGVTPIDLPDAVLHRPANQAMKPRNPTIARLATLISNGLKKRGFYKVLDIVRNSPVHRLVYGNKRPGPGDIVNAADRARLDAMLAGEREFLRTRYGLGFPGFPAEEKPASVGKSEGSAA